MPDVKAAPQLHHVPMTFSSIISLRSATEADERVLQDLSELDSRPVLHRPALLAVVDGDPVAALGLDDGRVVADPFTRTAAAVELLRLRAA